MRDIRKRPVVKKIRLTLSEEERKSINAYLKKEHYSFLRYLHIFFHSGSRTSELFRVKGKDVDLKAQLFKRTIIKGNNKREVKTMIKDIAPPLLAGSDDGL